MAYLLVGISECSTGIKAFVFALWRSLFISCMSWDTFLTSCFTSVMPMAEDPHTHKHALNCRFLFIWTHNIWFAWVGIDKIFFILWNREKHNGRHGSPSCTLICLQIWYRGKNHKFAQLWAYTTWKWNDKPQQLKQQSQARGCYGNLYTHILYVSCNPKKGADLFLFRSQCVLFFLGQRTLGMWQHGGQTKWHSWINT